MMMRMRPTMPYWPAYPEPERSRLMAEYRVAEAKFHEDAWREACIQFGAIVFGMAIFVGAIIWQLFQVP